MDESKILIVNLSKGQLGEDTSALLGSILITSMQLSALHRGKQREEERKPFYLFVDEFHSFVSLSFADILSEARKYGWSLFLAHQYIDQLHEKIRTAIFGNAGTIISFRVGAEDALYLEKEFYPVFSTTDFVNLPRYSMYLKLMIDGATSKPFSARTASLKLNEISYRSEVIKASKEKYCNPRLEVEQEITEKTTLNQKQVIM